MERDILWTPVKESGLEHLRLRQSGEGYRADGVVIGVEQEQPFRIWYEIQTDGAWRVSTCRVRLLDEQSRELLVRTDGAGHWYNASGQLHSELNGCLDVDITVTPFTNTLPIRRLDLAPGQSAELLVAYIAVPALEIRPVPQRYTCLERHQAGATYRYEGLSSGFTRDLPVDKDGLVIDYPGIWRRLSNV
jgi:hypothetical protein